MYLLKEKSVRQVNRAFFPNEIKTPPDLDTLNITPLNRNPQGQH